MLFLAVRLAHVYPIRRVRHEFPLRALYFRQVLPHVHGFPMLRVLCLIRHPIRMRPASMTACLAPSLSDLFTRAQSGFQDLLPYVSLTLTASKSNPDQELLGLPGFSSVSLPACHGLWTPADLHTLAKPGASVLPSGTLKLSASAISLFRSCTSTSGRTVAPTAYRILCVRLPHLSFAGYPTPQ
jgi:hypothetical protein